jgi:CRISPR-associated endonuclease/helicase Cas3
LDVAAVGQMLFDRHPFLRQRLAGLTQMPEQILADWMTFLFAVHDLGKFAESFQQLLPDFRQSFWGEIEHRRYDIRHDSLGLLLWHDADRGLSGSVQQWFGDERFYGRFLEVWLPAVTGHHGRPPKLARSGNIVDVRHHFRPHDLDSARLFCEDLITLFLPDSSAIREGLRDSSRKKVLKEASWLVAGLAVLCDWLGSDSEIFDYQTEPMGLDDYWSRHALPKASMALEKSGLLPASPCAPKNLHRLFPNPNIRAATPLQSLCGQLAVPDQPQLFILEDVTGAGKTEAAVLLAHRLISQGQAQGVFIALPTMATANAMYERMGAAYRQLYAGGELPSLVLAHGARHLSEAFNQSLLAGLSSDRPYGGQEETASVQCARWLADHRKKALLADVGIGTVDQALLAILPARHQSLRLLGLANKVLIVDEVHACDPYMHRLLQALLKFHARLGGSAILLSATLPHKMRRNLLQSFQEGLDTEQSPEPADPSYPLLTHIAAGHFQELAVATREEVRRQVSINLVYDLGDVFAVIEQATAGGHCVCWVRNTVHDAREAYVRLLESGHAAEGLDLFHSRYALKQRLDIEADILRRYGESSGSEQRRGRVLISTQVVEQSLDLDFDLMISDLAPIDLLIQRAGRLHRHVRDSAGNRLREPNALDLRGAPVLWLYTPEPSDQPERDWYRSVFPKANAVYADTGRLWQTARVLARTGGWNMPEDARALIEQVYGDRGEDIPDALIKASLDAEGEHKSQGALADFNALDVDTGYCDSLAVSIWDDEARIPTRLTEDSVTIYLAVPRGEGLRPLIDEGAYPWDLSSVDIRAGLLPDLEPSAAAKALQESRRQLHFGRILELEGSDEGSRFAIGPEGKVIAVYQDRLGLLTPGEWELWRAVLAKLNSAVPSIDECILDMHTRSQNIEFDPAKAAANRLKHGVSFADAESVFYDPLALTRPDDSAEDEERFVTLGMGALGRILVVVWTERGGCIRMISAREATRNERRSYED